MLEQLTERNLQMGEVSRVKYSEEHAFAYNFSV